MDPVPAVDVATLVTPAMFTLITLVASVMALVGVSVAVQVVPPSLELTELSVPLATVMSALVKPLTASLKVKVTPDVSPTLSAASATTTETVGTGITASSINRLFMPCQLGVLLVLCMRTSSTLSNVLSRVTVAVT